MTRHVGHIHLNVDAANVDFYTELYESLGRAILIEDDGFTGVRRDGWSIRFTPGGTGTIHNHDAIGINHLGIEADPVEAVDQVGTWIRGKSIAPLYGTPTNRPEFAASGDEMYYSVMFESPDGILLEVVYTDPRTI